MIVEGFGGPGGWAVALRQRRALHVGMELEWNACATRNAAGHPTLQCDVTAYPTAPFRGRITGKVDSPMCTPYSRAGKGLGIEDQPLVAQAIDDLAHGRDTRQQIKTACADPLSILSAEPMRWHYDLRPEWIVMEQVPDVLPLWEQYAEILTSWGYSVRIDVLNAADYGVPQTRRRAVLAASRTRAVVWPEPTHYDPKKGLRFWGTPWVSMAEALGWDDGLIVNTRGERSTPGGNEFPADGPSQVVTGRSRSWWVLRNGNQPRAAVRRLDEPAPTMAFGHNAARVEWVLMPDGRERRQLSVEEAAILQSFPTAYPFKGSRTARFRQVGNAVPPMLAAIVVNAAAGPAARLEVAA